MILTWDNLLVDKSLWFKWDNWELYETMRELNVENKRHRELQKWLEQNDIYYFLDKILPLYWDCYTNLIINQLDKYGNSKDQIEQNKISLMERLNSLSVEQLNGDEVIKLWEYVRKFWESIFKQEGTAGTIRSFWNLKTIIKNRVMEIEEIFIIDLSFVNRNLRNEKKSLWFLLSGLKNTLMFKDWEEIMEAWNSIAEIWYTIKLLENMKQILWIKDWKY